MAAFEKIKSGFSEMDEILDHIRLGDNVVWQVSDIEEFRFFRGSLRQTGGPRRQKYRLCTFCPA